MAPVDGVFTMSQPDMATVLDQLHPRLVLPMHYFTRDVVDRFVELVRDRYAIKFDESPTVQISRATLPERPTIEVLPGGY
jgi:L-ascorbate metabolism protein UlaG (beta-lactamase superfamily)